MFGILGQAKRKTSVYQCKLRQASRQEEVSWKFLNGLFGQEAVNRGLTCWLSFLHFLHFLFVLQTGKKFLKMFKTNQKSRYFFRLETTFTYCVESGDRSGGRGLPLGMGILDSIWKQRECWLVYCVPPQLPAGARWGQAHCKGRG